MGVVMHIRELNDGRFEVSSRDISFTVSGSSKISSLVDIIKELRKEE